MVTNFGSLAHAQTFIVPVSHLTARVSGGFEREIIFQQFILIEKSCHLESIISRQICREIEKRSQGVERVVNDMKESEKGLDQMNRNTRKRKDSQPIP